MSSSPIAWPAPPGDVASPPRPPPRSWSRPSTARDSSASWPSPFPRTSPPSVCCGSWASSTTGWWTTSSSASPTSSSRRSSGARGVEPIAPPAEDEGWAPGLLGDPRGDLLQRDAAEAGPEGALAHAAEKLRAVVLEGGGVEGLTIVAGQAQLHGVEPAVGDAQPQALDDERRVHRFEPVSLTLAEGEPAALRRALEGQEEEAQRRGVHDLGAVVEHAPVAVHSIGVLAHDTAIVGMASGADNGAGPVPPAQGSISGG